MHTTSSAGRDSAFGPAWPALAVLLGTLAVFFLPILVGGQVLYPHDNAKEVGLGTEGAPPIRATDLYGDMSSEYIPELQQHLASGHASWLATWNPHNAFGLPLMHYYGLGRAFILGNVLAAFTQDPFRTWSLLAVLAVSGAAVFCFLFLKDMGLHPLACLTGALGISLCPFHAGWETFIQLHWDFGFTFAFLWGFRRLVSRATFGRWVWLVFTLHALLLCGYPQHIVWCAYLAAGFVGVTLLRDVRSGKERRNLVLMLAGAAVAAVVSVAPVYLDLLVDLLRSTRVGSSLDLALQSLPALESFRDVRVLLIQLHDARWLGDPMSAEYPREISVLREHSVTPFFAAVVAVSLLGLRRRRAWSWWSFVVAAALLTVSPPVFGWAAEHLGLSLSRLRPVTAALVPLAVLAALGVDAVLTRAIPSRGAATALACLPLGAALAALAWGDIPVVGARVGTGMVFAAGAALFAWTAWRWLLVLLLVASVFVYGQEFVFMQPRETLRLDSPLVQRVRELTADGSRFAWVGPPSGRTLAPNQEALLGLRSVHYHNCFPSVALAGWAGALSSARSAPAGDGEETPTYSRRFLSVAQDQLLTPDVRATAGIGLLLSTRPLAATLARPPERIGNVCLSRLRSPGPLQAQLDRWEPGAGGVTVAPDDLLQGRRPVVRRDTGCDDWIQMEVEPLDHESLLFVSQEHHPAWIASAAGRTLETTVVNGLFEGVRVPPGTREVELRFLPWARWSFIPQMVFAALGLGAAIAAIRRITRRWRAHPR